MEKQKKPFRFPIRIKTILIIVTFGLVLSEIAMIYFTIVTSKDNQQDYKNTATTVSDTVALSIDREKTKKVTNDIVTIYNTYADDAKPIGAETDEAELETYLAKFDEVKATQEYKDLKSYLHSIRSVNPDTEGVYLGWVDVNLKLTVYLVYDEDNQYYPTGMVDYLYEEDYPLVDNPKLGFVASIYDAGPEGMLVTAGAPILDESDNVICYALVDLSLAKVRSKQSSQIVRLFLYLVATVLLLSVVGTIVIYYIIIKPIKTLQNATKSYDLNNPEETHKKFSNLKLYVHDELADLAEGMKKMENDLNSKVVELSKVNKELIESQKVAEKMTELANKDALTGVRNKNAYDVAVKELNDKISKKEHLKFGIAMIDLNYLKTINDDYGHDSGDSALIKLCNIVCITFVHSPVFRIGGDEFVVIVKGKDYTNSQKLVDSFNAKINDLADDNELLPAEKVSAAIGYSEYNPVHDKSVDDIFKRADRMMYERKHTMKNENK